MSDAALFLRKRKDKDRRSRVPSRPVGGPSSSTNNVSTASSSTRPNGVASCSASSSAGVKTEPGTNGQNANITEIKIFSSGSDGGLRFNFMRLNHEKEIDPSQIGKNILLNRKKPGPREPSKYAMNKEGKIVGKFVYDNEGKLVLDSEGKPIIERKPEIEGMDMSLVGQAPEEIEDKIGKAPGKKKMKKGTKEVFHQDIEIMRLRREEASPWILESSKPKDKSIIPEYWVGRMQEPSALPTVLLVNDGTTEGFEMVPLGRTYKFVPDRPFKVLDSDAANKMFEHQAKHKIHDRWALRPEGANNIVTPEHIVHGVKAEREMEERVRRMEIRMNQFNGVAIDRKPKIERFEDDYVKEGRRAERGLEGGIDEELDFDETEHFQDDDDVNTFYRNADEEDQAREAEEIQKKEYRLANANVGDKPQIADEDGEDDGDLFGEKKKYSDEGKKLKRIMKKRQEDGEDEDMFSDDDESDETDTESVSSKTSQNKEKERDKDGKPIDDQGSGSRPSSRGPGSRGTSSPTGKRPNVPLSGKASTAPPGSGAAFLAQRAASRGASPRPPGGARAGSPLSGRAASPETGNGRATSPVMRGTSPVPPSRGQSPAPARGSSPVSGTTSRDASPAPGGNTKSKGKRKTDSESPGPGVGTTASPSGKRKNSPAEGNTNSNGGISNRPGKKSKKGSNTPTPGPEDLPNFEGMITKQDVLDWFKSLKKETVPMSEAISAFRNRIMNAGKNRESNQKLFLGWMKMLADQEEKMLRLKEEYR
ncbi:uncharacterized protein I206_102319 [Kwoniella pini CBS 10737]|uniref:Transcription initiation factor IIF subunit alpha n=1 Tax=Kwoniella pini CBS 10737 TaxID=1296096 RepID=A0A1B9HT64_9TREE|nr:uncharacterized protein I206_07689 [Kwoniella pini CBS 10737]OCF46454.1 hypothetical protein I206_07689 [Kwoniella pini CBS 10737]